MSNELLRNILQQLVDLSNKAYDLMLRIEELTGLSHLEQDARYVALNSIQKTSMACVQWMSSDYELRNLTLKEFGDCWKEKYLERINGQSTMDATELQMIHLLKSSLAVQAHFSIENLFSNLIKTKIPNYKETGFYNIFSKILQICKIKDNGIERRTACTLANLRNSYHTNGIHNQVNMSITLNNKAFNFISGEPIKCASLEHIIVAISANIDLLNTILLNTEFVSIKHKIEDKFSALNL